jgi:hypothetical protein
MFGTMVDPGAGNATLPTRAAGSESATHRRCESAATPPDLSVVSQIGSLRQRIHQPWVRTATAKCGRSHNAIDLLAGAFKDHAVVFIAQPEPSFSKVVELGAHGCNETSLFGQAVDARRSNHVVNSASEPSSEASTMASLSPGWRPAKRSLSASRVFPICRTESQEAVAASTACATGMWVPPAATSPNTACGMATSPKRTRNSSKSPSAARYTRGLVLETTKAIQSCVVFRIRRWLRHPLPNHP